MKITMSSIGSIFFLCVSCFWLVACSNVSNVSQDPPPPANARPCPSIPTTLGTCSDGRIVRALLICGGPEAAIFFNVSNSRPDQPAVGTNRFTIQFMNGSRFQGSLITPDPGCWINDGTDIDFTFGAVYTGDQGAETADGSMRPCIRQSKMQFSSFNFDLVGNVIHEGNMKARFHETIDSEIIKLLGSSGGRCQRWREMP